MEKLFAVALQLLIIAYVAPAAAQEKVSAFGLKFAEKLDLPMCAGGGKYQPKKGMCVSERLAGKTKPFSGEAQVIVACCEMPAWAAHSKFNIEVVDGRLERVFVITHGISGQRQVLDDLTAKFGKPASYSTKQVQNGYGARYDAIEASWATAVVRVDFQGVVDGTSNGVVTIATAAGRDAHMDRLQKAPAQKLKF